MRVDEMINEGLTQNIDSIFVQIFSRCEKSNEYDANPKLMSFLHHY